ncbi:MAG: PaaI family thioesterase [Lachnospiraceae bacterium]|nr:PaaI family thioesterase [Lachnospiraceae bacterium]
MRDHMLDKEKVQAIIKKNPFSQLLGLELLDVSEGYAKGRIPMKKEFGNIYGGMHGGCAYALADTVAGIAAATYGNYVTTIDGKMNYLLPVKDTAYVYCEAKVVRQGGTIGVYQAQITDDGGKLLDTADFTYYRMDAEIV